MIGQIMLIKQMRDATMPNFIGLKEAKNITDQYIADNNMSVLELSRTFFTDKQAQDCIAKAKAFMAPKPTLWTLIVKGVPESVEAAEANVSENGILSFVNSSGAIFRILRTWDEVGLTNSI